MLKNARIIKIRPHLDIALACQSFTNIAPMCTIVVLKELLRNTRIF